MRTMTLEQMQEQIEKLKNNLPPIGTLVCLPIDQDRFGAIPKGVTVETCRFLARGTAALIDTQGYFMGMINIRANEVVVISDEYRRRLRLRRTMSMKIEPMTQ